MNQTNDPEQLKLIN